MKTKRTAAILGTLSLSLLILTACGGGGGGSDTPSETARPAPMPDPKPKQPAPDPPPAPEPPPSPEEEAEARRQAEAAAEAERQRQAEAEAERRRQAEAAAEAERRRQAEAAAEAERRRQAEAAAEAERQRQAEEERRRQAEAAAAAERQRQIEQQRAARITAAATRLRNQPAAATINARGAWAMEREGRVEGLTGRGVKIKIEDQPLDVLATAEFGARIENSDLTIPAFTLNDYVRWSHNNWGGTVRHSESGTFLGIVGGETVSTAEWSRRWRARGCGALATNPDYECVVIEATSLEDAEAKVLARVRSEGGYPDQYGDPTAIWLVQLPTDDGLGDLFTYRIVGNPDEEFRGEKTNAHGTRVASVAAGSKYGVAPGATLVADTVARVSADAFWQEGFARFWDVLYQDLSKTVLTADERKLRGSLDTLIEDAITADYDEADVINRSYGISSWSNFDLRNQVIDAADYWREYARNFPKSSSARKQLGVAEADKTLVVTAAGNDSDWVSPRGVPGVSALEAVYHRELRGLSFAVAALGTDGGIADYSNWCGALPTSGTYAWDAARDGRHYCLAAPGSVKAYDVDGNEVTVQGTSFAAPMVSGALALMLEHFRGQMTPRQIGLRMVNTANNEGRYVEDRIYGAGVLDLEAALRPVGATSTGKEGAEAAFDASLLTTPTAWGDLSSRLGGVEIAAFDETNAPFWQPLGSRVASSQTGMAYTAPDPKDKAFAAPESAALTHLAWTDSPDLNALNLGADWGLAFSSSEQGTIDGFGFSARPSEGSPMRYGLAVENGAVQGAKPSGAFGSSASSRMVFASGEHQRDLGEGPFSLEGSWTMAAGTAGYERLGMFEAGPGLYTAGQASLVHGSDGVKTRLTIAQPLRAESGVGTFTRPVGREATEEGAWIYAKESISLAPDARETRLSLRQDRPLAGGRLAVEIGHALDARHRAGEHATFAGFGYRRDW